MKALISLSVLLLVGVALNTAAITLYVDLNNPSPTPPYNSWSTAATNIQDAVDAAISGDIILVTNGTYHTGERLMTTELNRVAITNAITVRSVNGPTVTIIHGSVDTGVRCVYLVNGALLSGFTITNGFADLGGGVWCESIDAVVTNCVIAGNVAWSIGGGVYSGTVQNCTFRGNNAGSRGGGAAQAELRNCLLTENKAGGGGGASECTVINCTVTGNSASYRTGSGSGGGGTSVCTNYNSIIYYNATSNNVPSSANYGFFGQSYYSCTTPAPANGIGNISEEPLFADVTAGDFRLSLNSPCIDFGNNSYAPSGPDLEGNSRIASLQVDLGAFEFPIPTTLYVDVNSTNPVSPYTNWATAATVIQDAIDAAAGGNLVLVTNGVYRIGGRTLATGPTNRVAIVKPIRLESVNGSGLTIIEGFQVPGLTNDQNAVRCAYVTNGAALVGFTLTNGATWSSPAEFTDYSGGGVLCESPASIVSDCVIIACASAGHGGGTAFGTINNCKLIGNHSDSGGGASWSVLNSCQISGNVAQTGGGVLYATINNSLLSGNTARIAGGAMESTVINCTIVSNTSTFMWGGGVAGANYVVNSIVYYNDSPTDPNISASPVEFSCSIPLLDGEGNFTNAPSFVDLPGGNFRLQTNSPCINAGNNTASTGTFDKDGRQRIKDQTVDVGAYEFQSAGMSEFIGWLQGFSLPTDGSADFTDVDDDRMNNYSEWRSDTVPTNSLSVLRMVSATNGVAGAHVTWQSVPTRNYTLERSTNLASASPFQIIATSIAGTVGTKTFIDSSATNSGPYFYRVGVE